MRTGTSIGLTVRGLRAGYGAREVLHDIDLDVPSGGCSLLLGANGAGKSTTLAAIMGRVNVSAGTIRLGGDDLHGVHVADVVRAGVSLVPEGGRVFADLSVQDNLRLGAYANPGAFDMSEVYEIFPRLGERKEQRGGSLSGGERQMLAIGRALMGAPRVLLLDEPFLGLAPVAIDDVVHALERIKGDLGIAMLLVEQNLKAVALADHAYLLSLGEISAAESDPQRLVGDDEAIDVAFFGG